MNKVRGPRLSESEGKIEKIDREWFRRNIKDQELQDFIDFNGAFDDDDVYENVKALVDDIVLTESDMLAPCDLNTSKKVDTMILELQMLSKLLKALESFMPQRKRLESLRKDIKENTESFDPESFDTDAFNKLANKRNELLKEIDKVEHTPDPFNISPNINPAYLRKLRNEEREIFKQMATMKGVDYKEIMPESVTTNVHESVPFYLHAEYEEADKYDDGTRLLYDFESDRNRYMRKAKEKGFKIINYGCEAGRDGRFYFTISNESLKKE